MSNHMNFDFSQLPLDQALQDINVQGMPGMLGAVRNLAVDRTMTLSEIGKHCGECVVIPQTAGTAGELADHLQTLFETRACDGFMIVPVWIC